MIFIRDTVCFVLTVCSLPTEHVAYNRVAATRWPAVPVQWVHGFSRVFPWPSISYPKVFPERVVGRPASEARYAYPEACDGHGSWSRAPFPLKGRNPVSFCLDGVFHGGSRIACVTPNSCCWPPSFSVRGLKVLLEALPQPSPGEPLLPGLSSMKMLSLEHGRAWGMERRRRGRLDGSSLFSHYL